MLEGINAITNEFLEPIKFLLAYRDAAWHGRVNVRCLIIGNLEGSYLSRKQAAFYKFSRKF